MKKQIKKKNIIMVDISKINLDSKLYPRTNIDEQLVETYRQNLEAGIELPPLVVQKNTFTLIDGAHRFHALKKLKVQKVEVELVDIPDSELRAEAVRRNIKHGKRFSPGEIRVSIIHLRFTERKSLKEIAQIVNRSESRVAQIVTEYQSSPRCFSNSIPKVPKIDLRVKADHYTKGKILEDLEGGKSGKEIAEKHEISQGLVSQIKTKNQEWLTSPVYFKIQQIRLVRLLEIAFMNKKFNCAKFEFKKGGITVRNSMGKDFPCCIANFDGAWFLHYRLSHPIECYAKSDLLKQVREAGTTEIEVALLDSNTWKLRWKNNEKTHTYEDVDWRDFAVPDIALDSDGIPEGVTAKLRVTKNDFPKKTGGQLTLKMENGELFGVYDCQEWTCKRKIEPDFIQKDGNATASVDLTTLDSLLKISALRSNCFWIGLWSDQRRLAIGTNIRGYYGACFIL